MPKRKTQIETPRRIALISWEDTYYDDAVHEEASIEAETQGCLLHTLGFLIRETEKYVTVGMEFEESNQTYRHVCRVKRENIRRIQILE